MFRSRPHHATAAIGAALLAAFALTACSGSSSSNGSSSSGAADSSEQAPADGGARNGGDTPSRLGSAGGGSPQDQGGSVTQGKPASGSAGVDPAALTAPGEELARRATIALKVKNLAQTVAAVRGLSAANDGVVLAENIGTGGGYVPLEDRSKVSATTYGEITLSVPATRLDSVMAQLGKLGTVIRSESSSDAVGKQIVDTESRLKTMRTSVARVRDLMARATDLTQIVSLEAEVSRRQADLEALESQLAALKNSVARSPIQISLTTESNVIAEQTEDENETGFMAGLVGGWDAFTASVKVVLTVIGALIPFAAAGALIGLPLWLAWRRRHPATVTPTVLPQ